MRSIHWLRKKVLATPAKKERKSLLNPAGIQVKNIYRT